MAKGTTGALVRQTPIVEDQPSVDDDVFDPFSVLKRLQVAGSIADRRRIEHDDIREHARP